MSELARLEIGAVRNILSASLSPSPTMNLLHGENGSGKTSVLEAIHLLGTGQSFRSTKIDPLINHDADTATVFAELAQGQHIGLEKSRNRNHQLKLQGQKQSGWESVARVLPVQILDAHTFLLLEGGPRARRRFLDWGVFHVEPEFVDAWRRTRKCLANRNLLLKSRQVDRAQLAAWERELDQAATIVDNARSRYFATFMPVFLALYKQLAHDSVSEVLLGYERGWEAGKPLAQVLDETLETDTRYKATQHGPHRAELQVKIGRNRAIDVMSRGQQKLLVCALKLAQGQLLADQLERNCIYLVDDLPAELDEHNAGVVFELLRAQGSQIFVTCVNLKALENTLNSSAEVAQFHVERGTITA